MNDFKRALRAALITQFKVGRDVLSDDTELFTGGFIDSLAVMDLVSFVEGELGCPIPPADITLEHFGSIERIVTYARTLTGPGREP